MDTVEQNSTVYMNYVFVHLSADGHLSGLHSLGVMNSAAINTNVQVCKCIF